MVIKDVIINYKNTDIGGKGDDRIIFSHFYSLNYAAENKWRYLKKKKNQVYKLINKLHKQQMSLLLCEKKLLKEV
jgi:hypothetical protein